MQSSFTTQVIDGALKIVQTLNYSNGITSRRIFNSPEDRIPETVIWIKTATTVKPESVIEHREVELYNTYFKTLHGEG